MITRDRIFQYVLVGLLAAVVVYYGWVHWRVVWLVEPATARETAYVVNIKGYLQPEGPRPYSLLSLPGHTNLYGIGYLWGAAPFAAVFPFDIQSSLRIGNAFYLALMLCAVIYGSQNSRRLDHAFGVVLIYALYVSSPSIAAGPDIMACVFYVLAWLIVAEASFKTGALCLSIVFGFMALLTKPYLVLVVPAIASYLFLFRSIKNGVLYTVGVGVFFGVGLWLIHLLYPYYFFSVFSVHWAAASRHPLIALQQWGEFLVLAPVPCVAAMVLCRRWLRTNSAGLGLQCRWSRPFLKCCEPISVYAWGALVAAAALAISLSWHGGAHLIYFWHLLLPLLVLLQLRQAPIQSGWLCINLLVLLVLRPPLPASGATAEWQRLQKVVETHPRIYLDPYLQSLQPARIGDPNSENAQAEYLLAMAMEGSDVSLRKRAEEFRLREREAYESQAYDGILLTEGIFFQTRPFSIILSKYKITAMYEVYSYYFNFRHRSEFGLSPRRVMLLEPVEGPSRTQSGSAPVASP